MAGQARRQKGGKRPDDLRGEFTVVAVPGTHRDETRRRYGPASAGSRGKGNRMTKAMRQKLLLDARIAGRSWREAAKIAGYRSVGSAYEAAQEAIANIPKEAADEARAIEMQRIDEVIRANWPRMSVGDPEAGNLILRAIDRRAKLLGLDLQEPTPVALDMTLQAVMLRLVAQEPEEVRAELAANLALLAADEDDDQRATSRNNHRNGKHAQAVSRALTG